MSRIKDDENSKHVNISISAKINRLTHYDMC